MEAYVHDAMLDMRIARDALLTELDSLQPDDWARYVPYGERTLRDLLAHLASADQGWALAARGILKADGTASPAAGPADLAGARARAIDRGRRQRVEELREEMDRRRELLLSLYDLIEKRHLALRLPAFGETHNSLHERIWLGYHDRMHAADVQRAMRMTWHPAALDFLPELAPAVQRLSPDETLYVVYSVDPAYWEKRAGSMAWTYRELLAHMATGDWVLQIHLRDILAHGAVAEWPDVDAGNAQRTGERKFSDERALVEEFLSMRHETLRLLAELKPKHLALPIELAWMPEGKRLRTVLDYLLGFPFHDAGHREQVRAAMRHATARGGA